LQLVSSSCVAKRKLAYWTRQLAVCNQAVRIRDDLSILGNVTLPNYFQLSKSSLLSFDRRLLILFFILLIFAGAARQSLIPTSGGISEPANTFLKHDRFLTPICSPM
jgi:hypothetical protein